MTLFDLIALMILGVSVLVGFVRGALREVATVVAFVAAVAIAILALRVTGPIARATVHPAWAATAVALVLVFLASYIVIRVLASGLMRGVHSERTVAAPPQVDLTQLERGDRAHVVVVTDYSLQPVCG